MSSTTDKVIDNMNAVKDIRTHQDLIERRCTRAEALETVQQLEVKLAQITEAHGQLNDQLARVYGDVDGHKATIEAHEKTSTDLERRVKDLTQYEHLATQLVGSNAQLSATVHNISRMGAALVQVPDVPMTPRR